MYQQRKNEVETRGHKQRGILGFPLIVLPPPSLALTLQFAADKGKKKGKKMRATRRPLVVTPKIYTSYEQTNEPII